METKKRTTIPKIASDMKKTSIMFKSSKNPTNVYPHFPASENIPTVDEVLWIPSKEDGTPDKENSYPRKIRYARGAKSIFVDEWTDIEIEKRLDKIHLKIGFLTVPTRDQNLVNYLRYCGYNKANDETRIGSGILFGEEDYEKQATEQIEKDRLSIEAQAFVYSAPIDEIKAFAEVLCKTKAEIDNMRLRGDDEIRRSLIPVAQTKPETFMDGLKSQNLKNKVYIVRAIQKGLVSIDKEQRYLSWSKSGKEFFESPIGINVMDHFAESVDKTPENTSIFNSIKEMLDESKNELAEVAPVLSWQEQMADEAISSGIIITTGGNWFMIPGESEDDDPVFKIQGKKKLMKAITDNKDNVMGLIAERR